MPEDGLSLRPAKAVLLFSPNGADYPSHQSPTLPTQTPQPSIHPSHKQIHNPSRTTTLTLLQVSGGPRTPGDDAAVSVNPASGQSNQVGGLRVRLGLDPLFGNTLRRADTRNIVWHPPSTPRHSSTPHRPHPHPLTSAPPNLHLASSPHAIHPHAKTAEYCPHQTRCPPPTRSTRSNHHASLPALSLHINSHPPSHRATSTLLSHHTAQASISGQSVRRQSAPASNASCLKTTMPVPRVTTSPRARRPSRQRLRPRWSSATAHRSISSLGMLMPLLLLLFHLEHI